MGLQSLLEWALGSNGANTRSTDRNNHRLGSNAYRNGYEEHKFTEHDAAMQDEMLRIPEELASLVATQIGIKRTHDYCRKPEVIYGELVKILGEERQGLYTRSRDKRFIVGFPQGKERILAMLVSDSFGTYITFFEYLGMDYQKVMGKLNEKIITQKEKELLEGMRVLN